MDVIGLVSGQMWAPAISHYSIKQWVICLKFNLHNMRMLCLCLNHTSQTHTALMAKRGPVKQPGAASPELF